MRFRYGEKINDDSFLIREQFDIRDKFAIGKCKGIGREVLQWKLRDIARRSNVRCKEVPIAHGFRKFFTTQLIKSNVKTEARLRLEGHSIGITDHYWRPSEEDMLAEYIKSVNNLTINEESRLRVEVQRLSEKGKDSEYIIIGKLEEKDKQIEVLAKKQEKTDLLIQSLIDSGQVKPIG